MLIFLGKLMQVFRKKIKYSPLFDEPNQVVKCPSVTSVLSKLSLLKECTKSSCTICGFSISYILKNIGLNDEIINELCIKYRTQMPHFSGTWNINYYELLFIHWVLSYFWICKSSMRLTLANMNQTWSPAEP